MLNEYAGWNFRVYVRVPLLRRASSTDRWVCTHWTGVKRAGSKIAKTGHQELKMGLNACLGIPSGALLEKMLGSSLVVVVVVTTFTWWVGWGGFAPSVFRRGKPRISFAPRPQIVPVKRIALGKAP